jgi:hypothetical protein
VRFFCNFSINYGPIGRVERGMNLNVIRAMKMKKSKIALTLAAATGLLAAGCVERRVVYVPTYSAQPVYAAQPVYTYTNQSVYQPAPGTAAQAPAVDSAPAAAPLPAQPAPQPNVVVEAPSTPPAAMVETVPVAPAPGYVWAPGYWSWSGGTWVWVGGNWVIRPRIGAVWVGGRWAHRGHGYVWIGGHWR